MYRTCLFCHSRLADNEAIEEIAAIADDLTLPSAHTAHLQRLRHATGRAAGAAHDAAHGGEQHD
ncbi:MAG TPA: hypothetical protein VFK13_07145 [Gemmatimonadaceae bacterium]|nr:hypothetical protein [Gemmatimonadaceae bacterium]